MKKSKKFLSVVLALAFLGGLVLVSLNRKSSLDHVEERKITIADSEPTIVVTHVDDGEEENQRASKTSEVGEYLKPVHLTDIPTRKQPTLIVGDNPTIDEWANDWLQAATKHAWKYGMDVYYDEDCVKEIFYNSGVWAPRLEAVCQVAASLGLSAEYEADCGNLAYTFATVPKEHMYINYTNRKGDEKFWYLKPSPRVSCQRDL
jgi:hypothetical protein